MDAKIQIANTTDVLEGTTVTTLAGDNLFREGVVVSDPVVGEARARCLNSAPSSTEYGMTVRQVGNVNVGNFPLVFPLSDAQVNLLRTSKLEEALQNGVAYTGGGKISVTDNTAVLQLANPAGSGKTIIVGQFFLASAQNIDVQFRRNAVVASPTIQTSDPLNLGTTVPAVGVVRTGSTGYSSLGTLFSPIGRLAANITVPYAIPLILPPGTAVSAAFSAVGVLSSVDCYASAVWTEAPI